MEAADRMERGEIQPTTATMRDFTIHVYDAGVATFLRDKGKTLDCQPTLPFIMQA